MSEQVRKWQKILTKAGVYSGGIGGNFLDQTLAASIKLAEKAGVDVSDEGVTGADFVALAATKVGQEYVYGANVDLDDPDWDGPWDCAEFISWLAKQLLGETYGCVDNDAADPDPYTGGWKQDVLNGTVKSVSVEKAAKTVGGILLRFRQNGKHIVLSTGDGGTIEAKGTDYGVVEGSVGSLSSWDYGILLPGVVY